MFSNRVSLTLAVGTTVGMGIEDKIDQAKGRAEQAAGDVTDNEELEDQGERHENEGKLKGALDSAKDKLTEGIDKLSDKADKN